MTEEALHLAVVHFLTLALPDNAMFHHSPQENKAHVAHRRKLKARGTKAGWPDIEVICNGRVFFIELKAPKGRVTPAQHGTLDALGKAAAPCCVCRSVEEVDAFLRQYMPLRARAA